MAEQDTPLGWAWAGEQRERKERETEIEGGKMYEYVCVYCVVSCECKSERESELS
jgi:hypothetical protein